ncbi:MAG: 3'-5' exonuclease [Aquificota bacterium]|nr:MAG: 3'-5' exonuclease [Aquificota bacterium]
MYRLTIDEAIFTVVDIETTGFNPENNSIIEIAAIKYQGNVILDKFWQLIKPDTGLLPSHITKLTGITNAMVIDQPTIEKVLPDFIKFIKGSIIVGHNVSFDLSFLNYNLKRTTGSTIKNPYICTDGLARRIMPDIDSKSLSNLAYHFNIPFPKQHRAMSDAEVTLKVFLKMVEFLEDYNVNRVIDIIKLSEGKKINYKEKRKRYV